MPLLYPLCSFSYENIGKVIAGKDKELSFWQFHLHINHQTYRPVFQYDSKVDLLFQVEKDGFHGI
jgi:hypothetical protein